MVLIEILLPVTAGEAAHNIVKGVTRTLAEKFGGVTSFLRSPGEGAWKAGKRVVTDQIVVVEVMAAAVDAAWWRQFRVELEVLLGQQEIVIRSHEIRKL